MPSFVFKLQVFKKQLFARIDCSVYNPVDEKFKIIFSFLHPLIIIFKNVCQLQGYKIRSIRSATFSKQPTIVND